MKVCWPAPSLSCWAYYTIAADGRLVNGIDSSFVVKLGSLKFTFGLESEEDQESTVSVSGNGSGLQRTGQRLRARGRGSGFRSAEVDLLGVGGCFE
jgi:hypothetical protein